ncbi:DUF4012 domain-containing protein [Candidatus Gottesmanbacteria bacterium]|nr:DUF4012 domain-containing protein [Candidatus Gottesmanbacteria bacterium]
MTPANNRTIDDTIGDSTIARLDVQDTELGVPIKEFLTSFGCTIFVNENPPTTPEYHIIYGDEDFVKEIVNSKSVDAKKRLMILSGETAAMAEDFSRQYSGKTALVGIHPLSSRMVSQLFAFFFTGHKKLEILEETKAATRKTEDGRFKNEVFEKKEKPQEKLLRTFENEDRRRIDEAIANIFGTPPPTRRGKTEEPIKKKIPYGLFIFFCLLAPMAWYAMTTSAAAGLLSLGEKQLRAGEHEKAGNTAVWVHHWADRAGTVLHIAALPFQVLGVSEWFRGQERLLSFFHRLADAEQSGAVLVGSGKVAAAAMVAPLGLVGPSGSPAIATDQMKEQLLALSGSLGLAQSELVQLLADRTWPFVLGPLRQKANSMIGELARGRLLTQEIGSLFTLYPDIAGFKEKKTYLLLLQNSMELRPTGGFIGSVATVSMEEGRIADFAIHDVYALDGQLKGHVDPPAPIADLLQQEHWYLRDSNWDPDFAVSADRAAWFYQKEAGSPVDGVIGINSPFLLDFLRAVGPIDLADYNDRITAENFFGKSIYYTQTNFFPGSTQKKDFLGALSTAMVTKITGSQKFAPALLRVGIDGLRAGNILLWFANPQSQAVVDRLGWAGRIKTAGLCIGEGTNCLADRALWAEANVSVNKVNYFIKRTIRHQVVFAEDGSASESMAVTLTNTSPTDELKSGGGNYRVYGRAIVPADAAIESATVDGATLAERRSKKKGVTQPPYVVNEEGTESRVLGVAFDVPRGQHRQLVISYRRQKPLTFLGNRGVYDLFVQKQPGSMNTELFVDMTFPIFWQPQEKAFLPAGRQAFLANQVRLEYNMPLLQNKQFSIVFTK